MADLHIVIYCKYRIVDGSPVAHYARAYKYLDKPKNKTAGGEHFVYSYKAKRYVSARFYFVAWDGSSLHNCTLSYALWRFALNRIGLDMR